MISEEREVAVVSAAEDERRRAEDGGGDPDRYSVDEALSWAGFGRYQYWVLGYAGLGYLVDAMEVMILSFIGPSVKSIWGLSDSEEGLITTVVFTGMLVGAYSWGLFSDHFGRRKAMASVATVTAISSIASAFSPTYTTLLMLRALVGSGLGGASVYFCWFLEFVPPQNRGAWMVIFSMFWTLGGILEAVLAWMIMPRLGWRWLLVVSSMPSIAAVAFYGLIVESPRYLCSKGRVKEAHIVLQSIAATNKTKLPTGMLGCHQKTTTAGVTDALLPDNLGVAAAVNRRGRFSSAFSILSPKLMGTTFLIWTLYFGNAFLYYGVILMTSQLSSGQTKCLSAPALNGDSNSNLYRDVLFTSLAEVPGLVLAAILVDKVGRKFSLVFMFALGFLFLLPLALRQAETLTTLSLSGARMCFIGTFTITSIYCPEVKKNARSLFVISRGYGFRSKKCLFLAQIYPTTVRITGAGVANSVGRIGGMICPIVVVQLVNGCEIMSAILLFEAVLVVSGLSVLLFPVETKGHGLADTLDS
ncbi:hypothetical protein DM860_005613 [Cuscuta australis]|uniref:Major facilitator superfamily (MFS) profile domain-containing protein n=1 Tax=Cuscuta australis TaxID=267555 RepID=A0A328DUV4_9ASTE|nr:hypothetical protein DM860_005613 [Cuscuta australis]